MPLGISDDAPVTMTTSGDPRVKTWSGDAEPKNSFFLSAISVGFHAKAHAVYDEDMNQFHYVVEERAEFEKRNADFQFRFSNIPKFTVHIGLPMQCRLDVEFSESLIESATVTTFAQLGQDLKDEIWKQAQIRAVPPIPSAVNGKTVQAPPPSLPKTTPPPR